MIDKQRMFLFSQLFPREKAEQKYESFYRRKRRLLILMGAACIEVILLLCISREEKRNLSEEGTLQRKEWNEGSYEVILQGNGIYGKERMVLTVTERRLTQEELEALKTEAVQRLTSEILNGNGSLKRVTHRLLLPGYLDGLPFQISWESSNAQIINSRGEITAEEIPEDGLSVSLYAGLSYEESSFTEEIPLWVYPERMTEEEAYRKELQELLLKTDRENPEEKEIWLPEEMDGKPICWQEELDKTIFIVIPFLVMGMILLSFSLDRKLYEKERKREKEIRRAYPQFVSKLQLLIGAGMTPRAAFIRIGREYERKCREGGKRQYLYEEVVLAGFAFQNGKAETEVYRSFGRRCRERECSRLSFILAANLRQGNEKLLSLLAEEAETVLLEQRYRARKYGEEAGTKLLFPMLIMLLVVMFLILLPAMGSFKKG